MHVWRRSGRIAFICQTQNESTALIVAAERGYTECVRLLVEGGADTGAKDNVRALDYL